MVFVHACIGCGRDWTFHDDEREKSMLLCDDCQAKWNEVKLTYDIVTGVFEPQVDDEEENGSSP